MKKITHSLLLFGITFAITALIILAPFDLRADKSISDEVRAAQTKFAEVAQKHYKQCPEYKACAKFINKIVSDQTAAETELEICLKTPLEISAEVAAGDPSMKIQAEHERNKTCYEKYITNLTDTDMGINVFRSCLNKAVATCMPRKATP